MRDPLKQIEKLKEVHVTPYDLRRTFIAMGIENKIELWKLKLLTNHKIREDVTLENYTETSDLRYLAPESNQIAAWMIKQGEIQVVKI